MSKETSKAEKYYTDSEEKMKYSQTPKLRKYIDYPGKCPLCPIHNEPCEIVEDYHSGLIDKERGTVNHGHDGGECQWEEII